VHGFDEPIHAAYWLFDAASKFNPKNKCLFELRQASHQGAILDSLRNWMGLARSAAASKQVEAANTRIKRPR